MFLIIFATLFAVICVFGYLKHARMLELSGKINGPPGLPLFGNGLDLINKSPQGWYKVLRVGKLLEIFRFRIYQNHRQLLEEPWKFYSTLVGKSNADRCS